MSVLKDFLSLNRGWTSGSVAGAHPPEFRYCSPSGDSAYLGLRLSLDITTPFEGRSIHLCWPLEVTCIFQITSLLGVKVSLMGRLEAVPWRRGTVMIDFWEP